MQCCVLEQRHIYSPKVLVIPRKRWFRPEMTEKLLTWTVNINTTKSEKSLTDKLILIGDFNTRVGTDHHNWEGVIGSEGVGK